MLKKKSFMDCGAETKEEDQKYYIRRCQKFKYLGVKIDKEDI